MKTVLPSSFSFHPSKGKRTLFRNIQIQVDEIITGRMAPYHLLSISYANYVQQYIQTNRRSNKPSNADLSKRLKLVFIKDFKEF